MYVRGDPTIRPVCGLLNTRAALIMTHSMKRCFRITILSSSCGWYTVMARPPAHRSFFRPLTNDRNSLHVAWSSSADRPRILRSSREAFGQSEPSTALAFFRASARAIFTSAGTRSATALVDPHFLSPSGSNTSGSTSNASSPIIVRSFASACSAVCLPLSTWSGLMMPQCSSCLLFRASYVGRAPRSGAGAGSAGVVHRSMSSRCRRSAASRASRYSRISASEGKNLCADGRPWCTSQACFKTHCG